MSFYFSDRPEIDVHSLLRGGGPLKGTPVLYAASPLIEDAREILVADLEFLSHVEETKWSNAAELSERFDVSMDRILEYAKMGLLVCDEPRPALAELRDRDTSLRNVRWNRSAQQLHFMTKWSDELMAASREVGREQRIPTSFREHEERFGAAPPALVSLRGNLGVTELPLIRRKEKLFRLLTDRRTTRSFNRRQRLSMSDFSVLLYYCFGCHGYQKLSKTHTVLKKTSPSGGALHPIEVYPLVSRVESLDPGVYHYNVSRHSLELVRKIPRSDMSEVALHALAEQEDLSQSHVAFILVARFGRHFWKYRSHRKAYKVVAMDAAHLSQTLYLVCTQLGLGAYVTGAVNDKYIEELVDLDDVNDGVIAVCGAGVANKHDSNKFDYKPFVPRETEIRR